MGQLNVCGWTAANSELREKILLAKDYDVISVCETHLLGDSELSLKGYRWFGKNRAETHRHAPKGSGGVGFFIKNSIFRI